MNYFKNKEMLMERAQTWISIVDSKFSNFTNESVKASKFYSSNFEPHPDTNFRILTKEETNFVMYPLDTVSALFRLCEDIPDINCSDITLLNFASYKHPGGMFIEGSSAQEECLCHNSNLYPILKSFDVWYSENRKRLNKGLYTSDLIYIPEVVFEHPITHVIKYCNVITCAAPNRKTIKRYNASISDSAIYNSLYDRIDHILYAASDNNIFHLILGAFGCGVFGNIAEDVSHIFYSLLTTKYEGFFRTVVFAIPCENSLNYTVFEQMVKKYISDVENLDNPIK